MERQMWYATVDMPGFVQVLRGPDWTLVKLGRGTPVNDLQVATRLMMTREERNAGRLAFGLPPIEDDPLAPEKEYPPDLTWDDSMIPAGHRLEEAPDGVLEALAEWQVARDRATSQRETDDVLAPAQEGRADVGA